MVVARDRDLPDHRVLDDPEDQVDALGVSACFSHPDVRKHFFLQLHCNTIFFVEPHTDLMGFLNMGNNNIERIGRNEKELEK